ncbi:MAG: ABC transporter ATP-binding protein/permease [Clostridia bacterium]|nr:ABC transporter ATP-binding protein/permease [Clostridia bacterium]
MMSTVILAVLLGVLGNLCAIFIPVLGAYGITGGAMLPVCIILPLIAAARGVLHYAEQNRNHYLAFKILALIRDKVFGALRTLAPAKLEGRDKGDLIAVLTADIELLEVFYAHTISPICIASVVTVIMVILFGSFHPLLGLLALVSYLVVGAAIPVIAAKGSRRFGEGFRQEFGELDAFVLDSLRGLRESIQYGCGKRRLEEIYAHTDALAHKEKQYKGAAGTSAAATSGIILILDLLMVTAAAILFSKGMISLQGAVVSVVALMSSFGPTIALADLGTSLQNTFAAGNRVLDVLEEEPVVEEVINGKDITFTGAECRHIDFSYADEPILKDLSLDIPKSSILGIVGKSGSGKSTLLKLLMRFRDIDSGSLRLSDTEISEINTASLREAESFVTQDTVLFHDSIERNLRIAAPHATRAEIEDACRKASVHDFIMTLPRGYDTPVGELGETLSGGERQRLGIARAFLHNAPLLLLDEPTSNLDSLNEAVILKSLRDYRADKTILLVSHRRSTMCIADKVISVENGRMS